MTREGRLTLNIRASLARSKSAMRWMTGNERNQLKAARQSLAELLAFRRCGGDYCDADHIRARVAIGDIDRLLGSRPGSVGRPLK